MLTYLIDVTSDMLAVSLVIGVIFAFNDYFGTEKKRIICRIGILLGIIAAGIRAYITNTRRITGGWKIGAFGYGIALGIFVLSAVLFAIFARSYFGKGKSKAVKGFSEVLTAVLCAFLEASYLYCELPNTLAAPFKFDTGGNGILSTEYLFRLGGYLLALIICFVTAAAVYNICIVSAKKSFTKLVCCIFYAVNIIMAVYHFARLMLVLTPRKIINSKVLFNFAAASNNKSHYYTYAMFIIVLAAAVFMWIKSCTMNEPYKTNAEHRKQRAVWRTGRRWTSAAAVCFVMCILCSTLFVKLNTVVIREAPVEDPVIENGTTMRVPFELVEDGHLHRFGYKTEDGNLVRFIVVLKQENTNNYGIGLDACEICGEAGYYENKDNQIVCKKCNVVMNKTTIGMKGGCNPIIIDYDIDENGITVPIEEMVKNQDRFKN